MEDTPLLFRRIRERYAAKLAVGLLSIIGVTVAFGLVTQIQIQPYLKETAAAREVTSYLLGLILIMVISFGLLGVTIGSNTAITLRQLAGRAETMSEGDLNASLATPREDEFGTLYESFDEM